MSWSSESSLLWVSSPYRAHLHCSQLSLFFSWRLWMDLSLSLSLCLVLSYFLNELWSLIYSQVHGNPSRLEDDQVGLCWGEWGGGCTGEITNKKQTFLTFCSSSFLSVFETLEHPQDVAGVLWIGGCGSEYLCHLRHLESNGMLF